MPEPVGSGKTIVRRASVVALGTLLSRVLGLVRDSVIAACFTKAATDVFVVGFAVPNSLRVLLAEGAASGAFIPVLSEVETKEGPVRAGVLYARLWGAMVLVLLAVTAAGMLGARLIAHAYASGYEADTFEATVDFIRLVFPYIFLIGLASLASGALNARRRFAAAAFAPALLNVSLILSALWLAPYFEQWGEPAVLALAVGALAGGALHLLALLPALKGAGLPIVPQVNFQDPYLRKAFRLLVPLLVVFGVYQLNIMLSRLFASYLETGSQSYLYYGQRITEITQGMLALAIATAILPTLSALISKGEEEAAYAVFRRGLRLALFVAIPASFAVAILAEPLAAVLFGRNMFDAHDIAETAKSLRLQAMGIAAVASVRTVTPFFFAMNDTRTPVICSAVNLTTFVGTSLLLMGPLGHVGLAAAFTVAAVCQLVALVVLLRMKRRTLRFDGVPTAAVRMLLAALPMAGGVYWLAGFGAWSEGATLTNTLILLGIVVAGALAYSAAAAALRLEELKDVVSILARRRRT